MKKILENIRNSDKRFIYPQMGGMGLMLTNYTTFEVYEDSEKQLEIAKLIEKNFPTDFTYTLDFGTIVQNTIGLKMKKPDRDFPSTIENRIKTIEDIEKIRNINVREDGLFPIYLESIRKIRKNIDKPHMVAIVGPTTLSGELAGLEYMLRSSIKDKNFFREIIDFTTKITKEFCIAAIESGADVVQISEPVMSIIRPSIYRNMVLNNLKEIMDEINKRAVSSLHVCGDTKKYMDMMIESGTEILSLDQIMDMEWVINYVPKDIFVAGNLDPVEIMRNGNYESVYKEASNLLEKMKGHKNYMMSFGCDCPIDTPIDNMLAVIDAVNNYK
ncbi:uroporphyrinogen decarboxylase family protein [Peptacetobacter hiranonis]|uniref:uroporphyrinogen decarboxylase family protein n=1 Tax=Peptacetobacter hiranonis TaxID=89152 RepID=UPI003D81B2FA